MKSLRRRLSLGLIISMIGVFLLLGAGVSLSFRFLTDTYIDSRLEHDAESLLLALSLRKGDGALHVGAGRINPVYHRAFSGHYYVIASTGERLRSRSLWDQDLDVTPVAPGAATSLRLHGPERQLLRVRISGYRKFGRDISIAVAEDLSPIRADVRRFQLRLALFSVLALVVILLVQNRVLRAGLAPLARTREQVRELAQNKRRRLDEDVPAEVRPLVMEINRLQEALQQRVHRSRNALGNLAHALKTPLTLMRQLGERSELDHCPQLRDELHRHVDSMGNLMDRELRRARLAGTDTHADELRLRREVEALLDVLRAMYRDRPLSVDVDMPEDLCLLADQEDVRELLGNLLDNAFRWAKSAIQVTALARAGDLALTIADDGPGCDSAKIEQLRQRGVRADEHAVAGSGLGLSIAQELVESYGGSMRLGRSARLGGFEVELVLPGRVGKAGKEVGGE